MIFIFITIATLLGFWIGKTYSRTESRLSENELLDEELIQERMQANKYGCIESAMNT